MITVLKPGLLTTVQDEGRAGYRAFGMPLAGALDGEAYAAANLLAGNEAGAAALELTLLGGAFRFEADAFLGLAGADLQAKVDEVSLPPWAATEIRAGSTLSFSGARSGVRAYLAVRGGIDVPVVLGSRATYTRARVGGVEGRALRKGDVLQIGSSQGRASTGSARTDPPTIPADPVRIGSSQGRASTGSARTDVPTVPRPRTLPAWLVPPHDSQFRLRVLLGPQDDRFPPETIEAFLGATFTVSPRNDRMGYLLDGTLLRHARGPDIVSDGIVPGSVQVPGSGLPIVMMADCATVGGYTKIATVISTDLPRLAQARAGDRVRFERCTHPEAVAALRERAGWLAEVARWASGAERGPGGDAR